MSELIIKGLNLQQYALMSAEAIELRRKWEMSGKQENIEAEMLAVLQKYNQNPFDYMEDGKLNYHTCGLISEWHDVINESPDMLLEYSKIQGDFISKKMFGNAEDSANVSIEGVNLDTYARICANIQGKTESESLALVNSFGLKDMDHWQRVSQGFTKAMEEEGLKLGGPGKLVIHFGQLFAQYGQNHMAAGEQHAKDVIAEANEEHEAKENLQKEAVRKIMEMAMNNQGEAIIPYLKATFEEDADDNDVLDWYIDKAIDLFVDANNRSGSEILLGLRYDHFIEEEDRDGLNRQEWVEEAMSSLFI